MAQEADKKAQKTADSDFISDVLDRFGECVEADATDRQRAADDLLFLDGESQWDAHIKKVREDNHRPCLVINKLPAKVDQVVGDQRSNRPSIKVVGVDSQSDPKIASIYTGLIRNIETQSDAENAYDTAFEGAVNCGRGVFKIVTKYLDEQTFDQEILIKRLPNVFTFYYDPSAKELDLSDARDMFITEIIPTTEFEKRYPEAEPIDFNHLDDSAKPWFTKDQVRIAEYWEKTFDEKTIYELENGTITEEKPADGTKPKRQRKAQIPKIRHYLISGTEILEGPHEWAGQYFPIIPVWGKELHVEGERRLRGLIRHSKDAQRMYNYFRSVSVETSALAPKDPVIMSDGQIGPHQAEWTDMHEKNYTYMLYSHQDNQPPPYRLGPPQLSTAIAGEVQMADQDIKDTSNMQDASLGIPSNEKSGKAIEERRVAGDRGNFPFQDNLTRSLRHAGRVLVDLIPRIYDHDRIVRILGEDGTESMVPVNIQPNDPNGLMPQVQGKNFPEKVDPVNNILNDLSVGKYDVVISTGPNYDTLRQEAADSIIAFAQAFPQAAPLIQDLAAGSMDWPHAQQIAKRLKKTIPPEVLGPEEIDEEEGRPPEKDPAKDPKVALEMVKLQLKERELDMKEVESATKAILNIGKAEALEVGQQVELYKSYFDYLKVRTKEQGTMGPGQEGAGPHNSMA